MSPAARKAPAKRRARPPVGVPELLRELLLARGPSGYETAPARVWSDAALATLRSSPALEAVLPRP